MYNGRAMVQEFSQFDEPLQSLLKQWQIFSNKQVYTEYYIFEWQNDMDCRRLIQENMKTLSAAERKEVKKYLQPMDDAVKAATFEINECIWNINVAKRNKYNRRTNWYYYRVNEKVLESEKGAFTKK